MTAELLNRAARNGAKVRLKPIDYVQRFGPPKQRCTGCGHKPQEHDAGGRLDRLVLEDIATRANWGNVAGKPWGEGSWPSVPKIAARINYCDRSVQYALRRLVASGFLELVKRPGRSNRFRIVRHLEPVGSVDGEPESVDDVGDNRAPGHESTGPCQVAPQSATVAPDLGELPTDPPPPPPSLARKSNSDGAAAPAQPRRPERREAGRSPTGTGPPSPAGEGAKPHRRMRRVTAAAGPAPPVPGDPVVAPSSTEPDDDEQPRLSRQTARRTRRCPDCGAEPGQPCRGRADKARRSNHAARRVPDVYGPAARAGLWRPPRSPDEPAF